MNNSNAAAKKRRAGIAPTTPPTPGSPAATGAPGAPPAGMTLPQVIAVIDQRLITLEGFMKDAQGGEENFTEGQETGIVMDSKEFNDFVDEINNRFQIMAEEMNTLKDNVLKLQGYTMDVNKVLLHEITKSDDGEMPTISLGSTENVKFILESMKTSEETKNE